MHGRKLYFFSQVNIVVFVLVLKNMFGTVSMQSKERFEQVKAGVKASAVILPLLGITWLFGLLSFNSDTIAFKYIFSIFNSLQGLTLFVFHCVLNRQVKFVCKLRLDCSQSPIFPFDRRDRAQTLTIFGLKSERELGGAT